MIEDAKRIADSGKKVLVLFSNAQQVSWAKKRFSETCSRKGVSFCALSQTPAFSWATLTASGVDSDTEVLIDHYAIESRFSKALSMLHKYDESQEAKSDPRIRV